jgi:hypothetical protein
LKCNRNLAVSGGWHGLCDVAIEKENQTKKQESAMTVLRKIRIEEEPVFTAPVVRTKLYVVATNAPAQAATASEAEGNTLKNILLFFAAPFFGLAYIVALPLVGLAVLAVLAGRVAARFQAVRTTARVLKNIAMVVAAPVLGLAYIVLFPFIGLAALAWMGGRAVAAAAR